MDDLINWASIHPIAFTIIWLMIGLAGVILTETIKEKELSWLHRIVIVVAWPACLAAAIVAFFISIFT